MEALAAEDKAAKFALDLARRHPAVPSAGGKCASTCCGMATAAPTPRRPDLAVVERDDDWRRW